jgi:hypothetical protein
MRLAGISAATLEVPVPAARATALEAFAGQ